MQQAVGNRAVSRIVAQRLLDDSERTPLNTRGLQLEARMEAAINSLPAVVQQAYGGEHPVIDRVRAQLVKVRAPYGTDDAAEITSELDSYETEIALVEKNIADHLPHLQEFARGWNTFADEVGDLQSDLNAVAASLYSAQATELQIDTLNRKMQRTVAIDSKAMSALRQESAGEAMNRVEQYVNAGYVGIAQLNNFYASSYDSAQDDFGAAANLTNNTSSGAFQWLREWEFHIHGSVTRAGGPGTPVTGFTVKTGHIKPTAVARDTGTSITVPRGMYAGVEADSGPGVIRWANSKRGEPVLRKQ